MILLSGGVSAGRFDLVEPALTRRGASFHFTGARIQPGKPVVFGELEGSVRPRPFFRPAGKPDLFGGNFSALCRAGAGRACREYGLAAALRSGTAQADRKGQSEPDALCSVGLRCGLRRSCAGRLAGLRRRGGIRPRQLFSCGPRRHSGDSSRRDRKDSSVLRPEAARLPCGADAMALTHNGRRLG